jgi:hypothetical protein
VTNLRRLLRVIWDRHDCREDFRSHAAALHALGALHRRVRETAWRNLSMNVRTLVSAILLANGSSGDGSRVALATSPLRF